MRCGIFMFVWGRSLWKMWHANRGIASMRFAVYECSSVKCPVIRHQVGEKPWPLDKLSNDFFHTQTLAHTGIKEGEGQRPRSTKEGENRQRDAVGDEDIRDWHIQFFPLRMSGYTNWFVCIHLAAEGWLKEQSDILLVWYVFSFLLLPYWELDNVAENV